MAFYEFADSKGISRDFIINFDYSLYGTTKSFKEEVKDHFKEIVSKYKHVYLLFSGGMDSRFISLILLELGVDFTAITYSFSKNFDDYDAKVSSEFSKQHGFKHELFYIDEHELQICVDEGIEKGVFIPVLNSYYILSAVKRYNKPDCVFLTGACSEYKINNGIVDLSWNFLACKYFYPNMYNFTTSKIFLSYFDEPIIKECWADKSLGRFGARNKLYHSFYPDKLRVIEKQVPDDGKVNAYFYGELCKKYSAQYPSLPLTNKFYINLENHYKIIEEKNSGS